MAPNKEPGLVVHFKEATLRAVSLATDTSLLNKSAGSTRNIRVSQVPVWRPVAISASSF